MHLCYRQITNDHIAVNPTATSFPKKFDKHLTFSDELSSSRKLTFNSVNLCFV